MHTFPLPCLGISSLLVVEAKILHCKLITGDKDDAGFFKFFFLRLHWSLVNLFMYTLQYWWTRL
jgi:hypothetical protein